MARLIGLCLCLTVLVADADPKKKAPPPASPPSTNSPFKCPLPNRCTQECKDAFWKLMTTCQKEADAMVAALGTETANAYGKCAAGCLTHHDQCVGAATATECSCTEECARLVPAGRKPAFDGYLKCLASAGALCE